MHASLSTLLHRYRDIRALDAAQSLLGWDMQVLMPPGGAGARAAHLATLSRLKHEIMTSDEMARLVEEAERRVEPGSEEAAMVRAFRREYDAQAKLPAELVERKARISGESYQVWKRARAESDFAAMQPYYDQLFEIAREISTLLDPNAQHPYDPLHDLFEEGAKTATTAPLLEAIREPISDLVRQIEEGGRPVEDSFLYGEWDNQTLRRLAERITAQIGFDYDRGSLSVAPNAFCTHLANRDVRTTTKPSEHIKGILSSSLHEMGHGVYEQGSPDAWEETPLAGGVSLAVHESQSRMWENIIGRSREFWTFFLPQLQKALPRLAGVGLEDFYRAMNKVQPSLIRVGADELTYNLHIVIRFELEVDLVTRKLEVKDLPEAWNAKYERYLGLTPPNDGVGVLQDVHWSRGSVGYFPTYSMGNLISAQIWQALLKDLPDAHERTARGEFAPLLEWLRAKVYRQGKRYRPDELVERVTGNRMRPDEWLDYASTKFKSIYGLA